MNNLDLVMYPLQDFIQLLVLVLDVVHTVLENDLVYWVTIVILAVQHNINGYLSTGNCPPNWVSLQLRLHQLLT